MRGRVRRSRGRGELCVLLGEELLIANDIGYRSVLVIYYDSQDFNFVPCLSAEFEAKEEEVKTGEEEKKEETAETTEESTPSPEEKAQVEEGAEAEK